MQWIIICDASPAGRPKKEEFMTFSRVCILQMTHFKSTWYFLYCKKSRCLKNRQKVSFFYRKSRILWLLKIKKKSLNWAIFFTYSGNRKKLTIFKIFLMQFFGQNSKKTRNWTKISGLINEARKLNFRAKNEHFNNNFNFKNETFFADF